MIPNMHLLNVSFIKRRQILRNLGSVINHCCHKNLNVFCLLECELSVYYDPYGLVTSLKDTRLKHDCSVAIPECHLKVN